MQIAEVIPVEVAVGGRLPVPARQLRLDVVAMELVELQHLQRPQHVAEPFVDVELGADGEHGEHRAGAFDGRVLDQPVDVEVVEGLLAGHADQLARTSRTPTSGRGT